MFIDIVVIIGTVLLMVLLVSFAFAGFSIAPWVPAHNGDLERIRTLADLQPGQTFLELGSGDGRVSRYIALHHPDVTVIGIELSLPMYLLSRIKHIFQPQKNLSFIFGNALKKYWHNADVIYTFALVHSINNNVMKKFVLEKKTNAKLISYVFQIQDWPGTETTDQPDEKDARIHVYQ